MRYILQCTLAMVCTLVVLEGLRVLVHPAVIAALGASAFITFARPKTPETGSRYLIGGYIVGVLVGTGCYWMEHLLPLPKVAALPSLCFIVYGSIAVGLSMFIMVVTNTEHPPAASVALGFALDEWSLGAVYVSMAGITLLAGLRWLLRSKLINL